MIHKKYKLNLCKLLLSFFRFALLIHSYYPIQFYLTFLLFIKSHKSLNLQMVTFYYLVYFLPPPHFFRTKYSQSFLQLLM